MVLSFSEQERNKYRVKSSLAVRYVRLLNVLNFIESTMKILDDF